MLVTFTLKVLEHWWRQTMVVVVAQLVERSLSIPEVRGSTPVIGKFLLNICLLSTFFEKTKINKKRPGMAHFFKKRRYRLKRQSMWKNVYFSFFLSSSSPYLHVTSVHFFFFDVISSDRDVWSEMNWLVFILKNNFTLARALTRADVFFRRSRKKWNKNRK